jgi:hypothetical protein
MPSTTQNAVAQAVPDADLLASIPAEFPIESQTSVGDRLTLLKTREILGGLGPYSYLEIGSFLGGSLAPFVADPKCKAILSIDDRGRNQPDERGSLHDYTAISHQTMLDNLTKHGLSPTKVETFDGSVSEYPNVERRFDLMLIDGEHTDWACFRDFIHGERLMKPNSIVMFHDTGLILKSLQIIQEYLIATQRQFRFFKVRQSAISFVLLNDFCDNGFVELFDQETDFDAFSRQAHRALLKHNMKNRTRIPKFLINSLVRRD